MLEQLQRDQSWPGPSEAHRAAMVQSLTLMALKADANERVKIRATLALAKLLDQNLRLVEVLLKSQESQPVPEQHLHIHLGEHERRAHVAALLEEGIRNGSILPPG